ncbi:hypothetical protein SAMN05660642_04645 [Geodermatophilus siccatus]|uniref:Uncharacterized protein n=1 Tax=Geodermatophilus siccatus TaxID=1137991 RepID=A0A1H0APQ3_9ACTN|nr:hypothetical protein [Geodermatophilus siccatus]SDN35349.1 hypothetical protein SAMN05660642_04645 [Geodermatophilus siccatus]
MEVRTRLVASTPQAAPVAAAQESATTAQEQCCVPVWLPYGWYPTKAKCEAEGRRLMRESVGVVAYKCYKQEDGGWKLYLLESA